MPSACYKLCDMALLGHPASLTCVLVCSLAGRPWAWSHSFPCPRTPFPTVKAHVPGAGAFMFCILNELLNGAKKDHAICYDISS